MKKRILILIAAFMVTFFAANAHCYPSYMWSESTTSVSGSISSSYTGNKKFVTSSGTTVFTDAKIQSLLAETSKARSLYACKSSKRGTSWAIAISYKSDPKKGFCLGRWSS